MPNNNLPSSVITILKQTLYDGLPIFIHPSMGPSKTHFVEATDCVNLRFGTSTSEGRFNLLPQSTKEACPSLINAGFELWHENTLVGLFVVTINDMAHEGNNYKVIASMCMHLEPEYRSYTLSAYTQGLIESEVEKAWKSNSGDDSLRVMTYMSPCC
ncbi:hypothetical protein [Vibrio superstes]|uniref:Uncharacterized protein n=1 Tax=Vibrio superstes NBRC 103154 TaxID=1219062 RepID=A0A511QSR8_9VIBR|nr:hypothetical protein [Vibrio superstes]GEM79906.1 hypothetical protein VSU01S_21510 [Vibrio superstes NBRC 103154]